MDRRFHLPMLFVVVLALMPMVVAAQSPEASPAKDEPATGVLAEFDIHQLPSPHAEVWFIRMSLAPDGSFPMGPQGGPMIPYVESGELTLALDGPVITTNGQPATEPGEVVLARDESLFVPKGTDLSMSNPAEEPTGFLVLMMYAAESEGEGEGMTAQPIGLTQGGVSIGTAEFMPIPATVTIERVVVPPNGTMESGVSMEGRMGPGWMGMDLGAVESGSANLLVERQTLDAITWPGMLDNNMGQPSLLTLSGTLVLEAGDAYAVFNSTLCWTVSGDEPLTILRVIIAPHLDGP